MLGAIVGDVVGSVYEFNNIKTKNFALFGAENRITDDTVMTYAVYRALHDCLQEYRTLPEKEKAKLAKTCPYPQFANLSNFAIKELKNYGRMYEDAGYGQNFSAWLNSQDEQPYNSWGNGSAMRISPVAYFAHSLDEVKFLSDRITEVTHNHPEGMKGAQATACAVWLALHNRTKSQIKQFIEENYYPLEFDYEKLNQTYTYHVDCQNSVPQALYCFLISTNFEDAIRTAVSIGGDSDTIGAITGAVAGAYYGVPRAIEEKTTDYLYGQVRHDYQEFKNQFQIKKDSRNVKFL